MTQHEETVTITKSQFEAVALEAFADAARTVIERMVELAAPEHRHIVRSAGERCMAELETL